MEVNHMSTTRSLTTAEQVSDFISKHPTDELITRRQLIKFGSGNVVDGIIYRLIHVTGSLVRVAVGCYRKRGRLTEVTGDEVAQVKAAAFGRVVLSSPRNYAYKLGVTDQPGTPLEFVTNGRSSSFRFGNSEIILKGVSPRKMALGDGKLAQVIRALWHLGKSKVNGHVIGKATETFTSHERVQLGKLCSSMPAWLADYFYPWRLLEKEEFRPEDKYPDYKQIWGLQEGAAVYNFTDRSVRSHTVRAVQRC